MKRLVIIVLDTAIFLFLCTFFLACSNKKSTTTLVQTNKTSTEHSANLDLSQHEIKIDYDLTNMNFTMISSFFFQMLIEPQEYENKIFKIKGKFQTSPNEENPDLPPYFSVIINDQTMCCQEGIDFVWRGEHNFPEDYPEQDQEITIIGKYIVTETDGFSYNYLLASDILL